MSVVAARVSRPVPHNLVSALAVGGLAALMLPFPWNVLLAVAGPLCAWAIADWWKAHVLPSWAKWHTFSIQFPRAELGATATEVRRIGSDRAWLATPSTKEHTRDLVVMHHRSLRVQNVNIRFKRNGIDVVPSGLSVKFFGPFTDHEDGVPPDSELKRCKRETDGYERTYPQPVELPGGMTPSRFRVVYTITEPWDGEVGISIRAAEIPGHRALKTAECYWGSLRRYVTPQSTPSSGGGQP